MWGDEVTRKVRRECPQNSRGVVKVFREDGSIWIACKFFGWLSDEEVGCKKVGRKCPIFETTY